MDREIEPSLDLPEGLLRKANRPGLGNAFQPGGDVDAVAHHVAVCLLDHIAQMDTDTELDTALGRQSGIALDEAVLNLNGAAHSVDHAAKLDKITVSGAFDDAAMMHGDCGVDQIAAKRAQSRQGSIFVRAREPTIADHVRD